MKKYCYSCGKKLNAELISTTYDNDTGKPYKRYKYTCPSNDGKRWWDKHDLWEPMPDYY